MNLLKTPVYCALAAMPMALATSASAELVIDDFDGSTQVVASSVTGTGVDAANQVVDGLVLGGERDMAAASSLTVLGTVSVVGDGVLNFSNSPVTQGIVELSYDGADGSSGLDLDGLGGIDLTDGGTLDAFAFTLFFADFEVDYLITVYDTNANSSGFQGTLPTGISGGGDEVEIISPFASFTDGGTPADFTDVGTITLAFVAKEPAADITIDNFRAVPEPTSVALLLAGGALLARRRRRA